MATEIIATVVEGGKNVALRKRGDIYEVILGNVVLLSSAALETELEFGRLAKVSLTPFREPRRVLVGGLGFGSTLRGVLEVAAPDAEVLVAEKLHAVVGFVNNEVAHVAAGVLSDPRVTLLEEDVGEVIRRERNLDAILLDVDNGPEWASFRSNARIYAAEALAEAKRALVPEGIFAVWSGYAKDAFVASLRTAGFRPEIIALREGKTVRARAYVGHAL